MGPSVKKNTAPFGVATKRFMKIGFHPHLDITGAMKKEVTKAGPGTYNPMPIQCKAKRGMSWSKKLETEDFSKFLGYRNAKILRRREFDKSLGGPGCTDVAEGYYKKVDFSTIRNTGFGTGNRFRVVDNDVPAPSQYQNLDKMSTVTCHQFTNVMPFEWDGFTDRFKTRDASYQLPPNRYNMQDVKSLNETLNKVVSLRGPYDLFTGPRDGSTIKNHFTPPTVNTPEYGYIKPSDVDVLLNHPCKKRYGKFLKAPRYSKKPTVRSMLNDLSLCYRNPDDPGAAHYDVSYFNSIQMKPESLHPFDTSKVHARPPTEWKIFPGPGRYNPKMPKCTKVKRPSWVFLASGNRDLFKIINYSAF